MSNPGDLFAGRVFTNADQEVVPYDGSKITWRVSAYACVIRDDTVLIIKNREEKLCDIIGGGVEFGETLEEALQREAMEEAGATIVIGELVRTHVDWFYHRKNKKFHQTLQLFYRAQLSADLISPTEADTEWVKFVPLKDIGTKYTVPPIVEEVIMGLRLMDEIEKL